MGWIASVGRRGATITQPGEEAEFGPTNGRQSVIDNAVPLAVTDPGGGVTFTSRSTLQTAIDGNPAGTKFVKAAGGSLDWDVGIDCGTKAPKIYFLGLAGSTSAVVDAADRQIVGFSATAGTGFELHGGTYQNFGNSDVGLNKAATLTDDCLLEDFVIQDCFTQAFTSTGDDITVRRGTILRAGTHAWNATSGGGTQKLNLLIEKVRWEDCNTRHQDPGNNAVTKVTNHLSTIIRQCYGLANYGFACWHDYVGANAGGAVVEDNVFEDNVLAGIFFEGVQGGCRANRNYCRNNGKGANDVNAEAGAFNSAQILLSLSDGSLGSGTGIEVANNDLDDTDGLTDWPSGATWDGAKMVWLLSYDRGTQRCKQIAVHDNRMTLRSTLTMTGGWDSAVTKTMHANNNTFETNTYRVANLGQRVAKWPSATQNGDDKTWTQWNALGHDTPGGTIEVV